MPPETPSFPSTAITWMFVLYLPTFPPHHPSFLGKSSAPAPQPSRRARAPQRLQRGVPSRTGPRSSPVASKSRKDLSAWSCLLPPGQGGGLPSPCVPPPQARPCTPLGTAGDCLRSGRADSTVLRQPEPS